MLDKINKTKLLHIAIIITGSIFIGLSIFHSNMWFDESYSVALARHSFAEIWQIGGNDVHPILYYFCLHVLYLIFGNNLIVYRIFSLITFVLLSVIGYTHIRKDFGEKTGILFSFFALFLPVSVMYSGEIRMYSLGLLLGSLMLIYAYRIYKNKTKLSTFAFFGLSSLALSYTHYYGLMLAGIINLFLFINLIKARKERKRDLITFIIVAVIQVICYLPWLVCFLTQLSNVSKGFWISLKFPDTIMEIVEMQYIGGLNKTFAFVIAIILYTYITYLLVKIKKEDRKLPLASFGIYVFIITIALLISLVMQSVILLDRYLLIISGLIIFALSYLMAHDKNTYRMLFACLILVSISTYSNVKNIKENYSNNNREIIEYISSKINSNDIIIYSNAINGAVITTEISNKVDNKSYFYNKENWGVHEAYKAYSPYMEIKEDLGEILDGYEGRIWIIESSNTNSLLNEISNKYNISKLEDRQFNVDYRNYSYTVELITK